MATPTPLTPDARLNDMNIEEIKAEATKVEMAIREAERVLTALRFRRCDLADHAIRVRGEYHVAPWAKFLGVSFQALRPQLQRFWDSFAPTFDPDTRPILTEEDEAEIIDRYAKGEPKYRLAQRFGTSPATVRRILNEAEVEQAGA